MIDKIACISGNTFVPVETAFGRSLIQKLGS